MDELFESGINLAYHPMHQFIFENGEETEVSVVQRNRANCLSYRACVKWAIYYKNASILFADLNAEMYYAVGDMLGENSEPLLCRLEDGVVYNNGLRMIMLPGNPLMRRVNEIMEMDISARTFY